MGYGEHHLEAYDPDIGRSRVFTADELQKARGRSTERGYGYLSVKEAESAKAKMLQKQSVHYVFDLYIKEALAGKVDLSDSDKAILSRFVDWVNKR